MFKDQFQSDDRRFDGMIQEKEQDGKTEDRPFAHLPQPHADKQQNRKQAKKGRPGVNDGC